MDNATLARLLEETADLLEISGGDPFRVRSYRNAAEAVQQSTINLAAVASDTAKLLSVHGIGKGMATNIQAAVAAGSIPLRDELLTRYSITMLDLLKLPGMGPKTVALLLGLRQNRQRGTASRSHRRGSAQRAAAHGRKTNRKAEKRH